MRSLFTLAGLVLLLGEIAGFILVGQAIGVLPTLALVLASVVGGVLVLRHAGTSALRRIATDLEARRLPARPLVDAALLAAAALLLILPGFISDIAGLMLVIPAVRSALWLQLSRMVEVRSARFLRHAGRSTIDLDEGEYRAGAHPDSPWRTNAGPPPKIVPPG
jgi:UPF0716 protein FxsA